MFWSVKSKSICCPMDCVTCFSLTIASFLWGEWVRQKWDVSRPITALLTVTDDVWKGLKKTKKVSRTQVLYRAVGTVGAGSNSPLSFGRNRTKTKVIHPKYAKHWPYTVAHTIDCVCSKMFNHGLFLSLFKFFGRKYILNWINWG